MLAALAGNQALKEQLAARLSGGLLGHALILSGPEGSGKHTLAGILAAGFLCAGRGGRPCGVCGPCKKVRSGIHPDVITVAPAEGKKDITVDQARQLRTDAWIRPNEGERKVFVVEQADRLNANAQNALLKLLEEGPAYAAFLLLTDRPGALLPTVRSRCEELALAPVSVPEAERWLAERFPQTDAALRRQAALDCQGVLGQAVRLLSGGEDQDDQTDRLAQQVAQAWLAGQECRLMDLCVPMEKWERTQFTHLMDRMIRQLCPQLAGTADRRRVMELIDLARQLRQAAESNVSPGHLAGWLCARACTEGEFTIPRR